MKKVKIISILFLFLILLVYLFLFLLVPQILNSEKLRNKIHNYAMKNSGVNVTDEGLYIKANWKLYYTLKIDKLIIKNKKDENLLNAGDLLIGFSLPKMAIKNVKINNIYINENEFKNLIKSNNKKKTSDFRLKKIPAVQIKNAEIWADNGDGGKAFIILSDVNIENEQNKRTICKFEAEIVSTLLRNSLTIGRQGYIYIDHNALYAENLEVLFGIKPIYINGQLANNNKISDFTLKGEDLPIHDIESSLLYLLDYKKPGKQFIENFYNFDGKIDIDLRFKNQGIYGECIAHKLSANTVLFDIPILFPNVIFHFDGKTFYANATGLLGPEDVFTSFITENIFTNDLKTTGIVTSKLSNKIAEKYVPKLRIKDRVSAQVKYSIKDHKIDVDYTAEIPENAEIYYGNAYLGLENYQRKLYVHTFKNGDDLSITKYNYSYKEDKQNYKEIISGDGLFKKQDGYFILKYLTFKTNGYAPCSVTGSISKYIQGGSFKGNLKYDYDENKIYGDFSIINAKYQDFYVNEAVVKAQKDLLSISANGEYNNSDFKCSIDLENAFGNDIFVYNLDLFLDKYVYKNKVKKNTNNKINSEKILSAIQDINFTIQKWSIRVNKILYNKISAYNIFLCGSLKNHIFTFEMPHATIAEGFITANGKYNFINNSSSVDFSFKDVNSNIIADTFFNLPNQISGKASAKVHAETKNKLDDIKAKVNFAIDEGYLINLGSTEFVVKKAWKSQKPLKIKLQNIINVDVSRDKAMSSDIKGSFDMHNFNLNNINITSKQKYLGLLIEGCYNIEKEYIDLLLFGKYNRAASKNVKILYIPLNWIINILLREEYSKKDYTESLKKVPSVNAKPEDEQPFRVKVKGNLNGKELDIELKSIK